VSLIGLAQELVERNGPVESVVRQLRNRGCSLAESIAALTRAGIPYKDARSLVLGSEAWQDVRDAKETYREVSEWIEPRGAFSDETIERLSAICARSDDLLEAWLLRRSVTLADGGGRAREEARVDFVFTGPLKGRELRARAIANEVAEEVPKGEVRMWVSTVGTARPEATRHGSRFYRRDQPGLEAQETRVPAQRRALK
jgi:hypothetical protein